MKTEKLRKEFEEKFKLLNGQLKPVDHTRIAFYKGLSSKTVKEYLGGKFSDLEIAEKIINEAEKIINEKQAVPNPPLMGAAL